MPRLAHTAPAALLSAFLLLVFLGADPAAVRAQDAEGAPADSPADSLGTDTPSDTSPASVGLMEAVKEAGREGNGQVKLAGDRSTSPTEPTSFIVNLTNTPKFGIQTNATSNSYYGNFSNVVIMRNAARLATDLSYRWGDFRQQIKTTESRTFQTSYSNGTLLPFGLTIIANRDWNEDRTTNSSGTENIARRDNQRASMNLSAPQMTWRNINFSLKSSSGLTDNKSITQGQRNDVSEAFLDGGLKMGTEIVEGVSVAGRLYGRTSSAVIWITGGTPTASSTPWAGMRTRRLSTRSSSKMP